MDEQPEHVPTREPSARVELSKLDYAVPPKKSYGRDLDRLIRRLTPPFDADLRRWWWRRFVYRLALFLFFAVIALYLGPNLLEFGRLTQPNLSDFVPIVQGKGVPLVKAVKLYKLDHGRFPKDESELIPEYLPSRVESFRVVEGIMVIGFVGHNERVQYYFDPGAEGWYLDGPWLSGQLPLPPVTIDPSMRPRTQPVR
jgi:hypothetical protein